MVAVVVGNVFFFSQLIQVEVHAHAATAAASGRMVMLTRVALPLFSSILPE